MFNLRGLEIHSSRMWRWASVEKALGFMERFGLNALIFHQNDLTDELVLPEKYIDEQTMLDNWPVRLHTIQNNRQYIRQVIREASDRGISFYMEVKELWYPEALPALFPDLRGAGGQICASNPFWWEFLSAKYRELLEAVPELSGIIVSPATEESKVSIVSNHCTCDRCRSTDPLDWYQKLIDSIHRPLNERNKVLAVRDFSKSSQAQSLIVSAASKCSKRIIITLKNTPHDFYPTFPNNPRIGNSEGHPQWVEIDTWGQFFGLGFFPVSVAEDMQERILFARENGVSGIWFRTDWEVVHEASVFNSLNLLNLVAGALLVQDPDRDVEEAYRTWIDYGLSTSLKQESVIDAPISPAGKNAWSQLKSFMKASWKVMEKTAFVRGHVFHEDMMFPNSVHRAFDMMLDHHGREDWEPGASSRLTLTAENLGAIFAEKEAACREVDGLREILRPETLGVPEPVVEELAEMLDLYRLYVRGFDVCTRVCFLTRKAEGSQESEDLNAARAVLSELSDYRQQALKRLSDTRYPHYVYWLFDERRLSQLIRDAEISLDELSIGKRSGEDSAHGA